MVPQMTAPAFANSSSLRSTSMDMVLQCSPRTSTLYFMPEGVTMEPSFTERRFFTPYGLMKSKE